MSVDSGGFQRPVNPVLAKPCSHTGRSWPGYLISMREPDFTRKPDRLFCDNRREPGQDAGWSSLVARQAHNLKVAGSNPAPATTHAPENIDVFGGFHFRIEGLSTLGKRMGSTGSPNFDGRRRRTGEVRRRGRCEWCSFGQRVMPSPSQQRIRVLPDRERQNLVAAHRHHRLNERILRVRGASATPR